MKRLIYILCTFFTLSLFAQQIDSIDSRLLFRYDAEFLNNLVLTNPSKLNYLNFYVGNSYTFHQSEHMPLEKLDQIPNILNFISVPDSFEIPNTIDQTNFNILMFDVVFQLIPSYTKSLLSTLLYHSCPVTACDVLGA